MVKVNNMNVFDCLTSIDKNRMVELVINEYEIYTGCPDDVLRHMTYEQIGINVKSMGIDFDTKAITFDCGRIEEK